MSTVSSSNPMSLNVGGMGPAFPRMFIAATTLTSSAVADTGRWAGCGKGGNPSSSAGYAALVGMRVGDVLLHISSSGAANPARTSLHSVLSATANQTSTTASTGFNAVYDVTVSLST